MNSPAAQQTHIERIATEVRIGERSIATSRLHRRCRLDEALGMVVPIESTGSVPHRSRHGGLFEARVEKMPDGDYLLMFPEGLPGVPTGHYAWNRTAKNNDMIAMRSRDLGRTWSAPVVPFTQPFGQHAFVPFIPRGGTRVYYFGTQPDLKTSEMVRLGNESAPIGFRSSDDAGRSWSGLTLIRPGNDPEFQGMAVNRMCETVRGTWLIGASWHAPKVSSEKDCYVAGRINVLRSTDRGATWTVLPGRGGAGWLEPGGGALSEPTVLALPDGEVYLQTRSTSGTVWELRSVDDGLTWSEPRATPLVHAWSPAMPFLLGDGRTIASVHHNVAGGTYFDNASLEARAQLWVSLSRDAGRTWSEPRFLLANAVVPATGNAWMDHQCAYIDLIVDQGMVNIVIPHLWRRVVHLQLRERSLETLPTRAELGL